MDKRAAEIERFVRQHNIEHYRKLLGEPTDPLRRQQLQMLLASVVSNVARKASRVGPYYPLMSGTGAPGSSSGKGRRLRNPGGPSHWY